MRLHSIAVALAFVTLTMNARADEPRYVQQNGVTYLETPTSATVRRLVPDTRMEEREETVYRREIHNEVKEVERRYSVPITEYRREMRWHGTWNPFSQPYMVEHLVPVTRWETRTETVKIPTARVALVPEKRTRQVPITTYKEIEVPVVARTIVPPSRTYSPAPTVAAAPRTNIATRNRAAAGDPFVNNSTIDSSAARVGGVSRLDSDPPRQSSRHDWRPLDSTTRRR
ncbi:MAG: hypothetical protein AB7O62_18125 [Pirellulales bacterium]